jgi:chemotaxis protein MotA
MALETHIENPAESPAFQRFPRVLASGFASALICDYLRMVGMNADDPNRIEDVMARELKTLRSTVPIFASVDRSAAAFRLAW